MEHSLNQSKGKAVSGSANEESGWTSYLEDFSKGTDCSSLGGSSLVSDAASCAAWKLSHHSHLVSYSSVRVMDSSNNVSKKKLCFKKTRIQQISDDDPLEDTASSPVNSPKVGGLKVSSKIDDQLDGSTSRGKGFQSESYAKTDECGLNFNGNNIECNTNLKEKGLCLVPFSMLVNYYG